MSDRIEYQRKWRAEHKDQANASAKRWYYANRKQANEASMRWRENHREQERETNRRLYRKNPEKFREKSKALHKKRLMMIIDHYTEGERTCQCCGENIVRFLTIDHINNDGKEQRKVHGSGSKFVAWIIQNNYPKDLQVLCFNCNCGKSLNNGVCPHKETE